jgi:hypothetical protein
MKQKKKRQKRKKRKPRNFKTEVKSKRQKRKQNEILIENQKTKGGEIPKRMYSKRIVESTPEEEPIRRSRSLKDVS